MDKQVKLILTLLPLLFVTTISVSGATFQPNTADPINLIDQAFRENKIDLNAKARLIAKAIKSPELLPLQYQTEAVKTGSLLGRSATMAIVDIKNNWDLLDPETQRAFAAALSRPSGGILYPSPSGYFLLHYNTSGGDAIPTTDADANGIPDYIERVATYCDTTLWVHQALSYREPPTDGTMGGDSRYDVYFESMGYYGYAVPENAGPEPWNDASSYLVLHRNFYGFPPNTDPEGNQAGAAKATVAHEFHHSVQFAYDYGDEGWFMEMDATYMEDVVFDQVNDNYNYLPSYLADPQSTLTDNSWGYSRFIWGIYLADNFDTSLMVAAWEGGRYTTAMRAISDTLEAYYGTTLDQAFVEYTTWNYFTGSRDLGLHYEEASFYPSLSVAKYFSTYPVSEQLGQNPVFGYGASYIVFNSNGETGTLTVGFKGSTVRDWSAHIIKVPSGGGYSVETISLDANNDGTIQVDQFENYDRVILVAANIQEYSGSSSFHFSANITTPFLFATELLSDSAVYPGELKYFDYRVTNNSGTSEVIDIFFEDAEGWDNPVQQNYFLADGESLVARLPLNASALVSLGDQSRLSFRAQLRTDPLSGNDDSLLGLAVPKRGDVNYDGRVNLADITSLISFVYLDGEDPSPLESGDFNCDTKHNLTDITMVISFVYLEGNKSPCDSFEQM